MKPRCSPSWVPNRAVSSLLWRQSYPHPLPVQASAGEIAASLSFAKSLLPWGPQNKPALMSLLLLFPGRCWGSTGLQQQSLWHLLLQTQQLAWVLHTHRSLPPLGHQCHEISVTLLLLQLLPWRTHPPEPRAHLLSFPFSLGNSLPRSSWMWQGPPCGRAELCAWWGWHRSCALAVPMPWARWGEPALLPCCPDLALGGCSSRGEAAGRP